ncbi:MAG: prolipoprotein diacylglyceryl transferase [Lachnospiraceae bacterium]|nr:prolipoprotein diacylglyceryl transferase [Lachnospiraceae bacterium]
MMPIIQIGIVKIYVFQIILSLDFYICFFYLLFAKPYCWLQHRNYIYVTVFALAAGAAGGRLLSAVTLYFQDNSRTLLDYFIHGGSVFYGILVTGFFSACLFARRYKIDFCRYASDVAQVLPLGQALGRIGCFMNGCCYGKEYNGPFGILYPVDGLKIKVFPVWFAEAFGCLLLFLFFRKNRFKRSRHSFLIYFITYGSLRYFVEFWRGDTIRGVYGWISTSQIISMIIVVSAVICLMITKRSEVHFNEKSKDN